MEKMIRNLAVASLMLTGATAQATVYDVTAVLSGGGGFGASLFHDASGSNPMTGAKLADIPNANGLFGTYDDVSNFLDVTLATNDGTATSFRMYGTIDFDGSGLVSANSVLNIDFNADNGALSDTQIGFLPGYVCCGSSDNDPNSFNPNGNNIMTLWGANFATDEETWLATATGSDVSGSYAGSTLGMDIRLQLQPVPVPAAVWLFGSGLLGLVGIARRRVQEAG